MLQILDTVQVFRFCKKLIYHGGKVNWGLILIAVNTKKN